MLSIRAVDGPVSVTGPSAAYVATGVAAGLLGGVLAQLADDAGPWAGNVASYGGVWLLGVAILTRRARSTLRAAAVGVGFLLGLVAGYYATYAWLAGGWPARFVALWSVAALLVGPVLGTAGRLAAKPTTRGAVASGILAGLLLAEATFVAGWRADPTRWGAVGVDVVGAAVLLRAAWSPRRALLVTVTAGAAGLGALLVFQAAIRTWL